MENYPLLFFPYATEGVKVGRRRNISSNVRIPDAERQIQRLTPVFNSLRQAIESMSMHIQDSPECIDPETVLVLKTVNSVEDFANAVKHIEGMEWLGEFDIDDITPDDDFYDTKKSESLLSGRLYMVSTNKKAILELLTLWQRYSANPQAPFDRGYTKFKEVFIHLKEIRRWNSSDRFEGTSAKEYWKEQIEVFGQDTVRFEVELWHRSKEEQLNSSFNRVTTIINRMEGSVISRCSINEIQYSAILVELPAASINNLLEDDDVELVKCEDIMFFRPSGQMTFGIDTNETIQLIESTGQDLQASGNPVIGIFDGYPMANHKILSNRLIIDDPDNYGSAYKADQMIHGTAMCSLIVKGDLQNNEDFITSPLYVRPIMKPNPRAWNREEHVPSDSLLIDVVHRSVKEMYDSENGHQPSAPTVKVINFSIGDPARMFISSMSPLARLIDWLSFKYSILFIISAGNHTNNFDLPVSEADYLALPRRDQEKLFTDIILSKKINQRILSPAESINSISVGAVHNDVTTINTYDRRINPFDSFLPATYSSFGAGHRGSIKPDLVYDGGRLTYLKDEIHFSPLKPKTFPNTTPGQQVASPDKGISGAVYCQGTSNSAALTTRRAFYCYKAIEDMSLRHAIGNKHIAILIKAMLIHGCSWYRIGNAIDSILDPAITTVPKKKLKSRWIGYGYPDSEKSLSCNPQRATVIGLGAIKKGKAELYNLPIPECLNAKTNKRKLTITLAWFSPINSRNQKYRTARLWFEVSGTSIFQEKEDVADENLAKKGTIQHEVFVGSKALAIGSDDSVSIKVTCDRDAANITDEIPYALMVSLEVAKGVDLPIYQEISMKISASIPVQVGSH